MTDAPLDVLKYNQNICNTFMSADAFITKCNEILDQCNRLLIMYNGMIQPETRMIIDMERWLHLSAATFNAWIENFRVAKRQGICLTLEICVRVVDWRRKPDDVEFRLHQLCTVATNLWLTDIDQFRIQKWRSSPGPPLAPPDVGLDSFTFYLQQPGPLSFQNIQTIINLYRPKQIRFHFHDRHGHPRITGVPTDDDEVQRILSSVDRMVFQNFMGACPGLNALVANTSTNLSLAWTSICLRNLPHLKCGSLQIGEMSTITGLEMATPVRKIVVHSNNVLLDDHNRYFPTDVAPEQMIFQTEELGLGFVESMFAVASFPKLRRYMFTQQKLFSQIEHSGVIAHHVTTNKRKLEAIDIYNLGHDDTPIAPALRMFADKINFHRREETSSDFADD